MKRDWDVPHSRGGKAKSIEYYEKALAIDRKLPSAIEALKRLKGKQP